MRNSKNHTHHFVNNHNEVTKLTIWPRFALYELNDKLGWSGITLYDYVKRDLGIENGDEYLLNYISDWAWTYLTDDMLYGLNYSAASDLKRYIDNLAWRDNVDGKKVMDTIIEAFVLRWDFSLDMYGNRQAAAKDLGFKNKKFDTRYDYMQAVNKVWWLNRW